MRTMLLLLGATVAGCGSAAAGSAASSPPSVPGTLSQPAPISVLPAATFAARDGWSSGDSSDPGEPNPSQQTFTWMSTATFRDAPFSAPPMDTLAAMKPDDVLIEVFLWRPGAGDSSIAGRDAIELPPPLDGAAVGQGFPGGDGTRWLQRAGGRVGDRMIDIWVFAGRAHPTAAQVASAQAVLDTMRLPAWPNP